jgi:transglutaminase-like putative cysteine protease
MEVRTEAVNIVSETTYSQNSSRSPFYHIKPIHDYTRDEISYVSDPKYLEYISPPEETLESRGGDCDDQAILAASMLEAVGEEVGLVLCGNGSEYHLFPIVKKGVDGQDQSLKTKLTWLYTQDRTIVPNYGTVSFTVSENELWWPVDSTARTIGDIDGLLEEGFIINNGNGWDFFDVSYHFRDKNDRSIEFG